MSLQVFKIKKTFANIVQTVFLKKLIYFKNLI
jgi:hypothetical protein